MGVFDRFRGRPATQLAAANVPQRALTAAAKRIDLQPDRRALQRRANVVAQACWNAYDHVGEVGYVIDLFGNAMRRIRIFPAGVDDPEQGRIPLADCDWATEQVVRAATDELERVRSLEHGQGEVLAQMAINFKTPGEGYLYGAVDPDLGEEDWQVLSTDALGIWRRQWAIYRYPNDRQPAVIDLDQALLYRFWQRHPRWPGLAHSELARVLSHVEGLQIIERGFRSRGRQRLAGAGILVVAQNSEIDLDDLEEHMLTPMVDESSGAAVVPMTVDVPGDDATKALHHLTFDRPLSEIEERREDRLLRRIAQGLDAPPELITGMADVNHWTAWQVEDSTYEAHIEPLALRIADALAIAVVRPALLRADFPPELVARVQVGVDPSDLIRRPNAQQDANDAHDRLVISDATYRQKKGFTDDDAPDEEELLRRIGLKRGTIDAGLAEVLLRLLDPSLERPTTRVEDGQVIELEQPAEDEGDEERGTPDTAPDEVTAAAATRTVAQLGRRLADLDRNLAARLQGACDAAVERALERAGNRLRSRLRRTEHAARINHLRAGQIPAALGRDLLADLGIGDEDLVTDADFDTLHDQWDTWTAAAWLSAVGEVEAVAGDQLEVTDPEEDRDAGWLLLLAALLVATRTRLSDATTPAAGDEELGELDTSLLTPPGVIRSALARAGGATGTVTDGGAVLVDAGLRPAGGVASGELILRVVTEQGMVLTGWTWVHGTPSAPFEPHVVLDGVEFDRWDAEVLANDGGVWPFVSYFHPGDHRGCTCGTYMRLAEPSSN